MTVETCSTPARATLDAAACDIETEPLADSVTPAADAVATAAGAATLVLFPAWTVTTDAEAVAEAAGA